MSQIDLEREDFETVITFILRREAMKTGKIDSIRKYVKDTNRFLTDQIQANNV